jgi:hypothetical protein
LIIILAHLAAKYIRNYHLQDTFSHQAGVFGKLVSLIALSPLDKAEPVVAPVTK